LLPKRGSPIIVVRGKKGKKKKDKKGKKGEGGKKSTERTGYPAGKTR